MLIINRGATVFTYFKRLLMTLFIILSTISILYGGLLVKSGTNKTRPTISKVLPKLVSSSLDLCGSNPEIQLSKESSSVTVTLNTVENKGICKLKILAPKTHVVNMQIVETISTELRRALKLNRSDSQQRPTCMMNVFLSDNLRMPYWKGDLCSDEDLPDIDLLTPDFRIIWNPPSNVSFVNGKKFVITAVGQRQTCKEPGQHTCMKIGREPIFCVSKQLLCDGNINCPSTSSNSDEDEKLCKKSRTAPTLEQIAIEMLQNRDHEGDKWIQEQLSKHLDLNMKSTKLEPKKLYGSWRKFQDPKPRASITSTTEKPDDKPKVKSVDSISAALSKYGPWGYLVLGTVICGAVLMICGLWECCFKRHKNQTTATQSQQPTTVLIINEEEIATSPPTYDELDQPPSYSTLFPTKESEDSVSSIQSASGESAHTQNSDSQNQTTEQNSDSQLNNNNDSSQLEL